jgi:hypothetical protein
MLAATVIAGAITGTANATLTIIGTATYNGSVYNIIYDDNPSGSVVWLDYSNPANTWQNQATWARSLNDTGIITYNLLPVYSVNWSGSWQLPTTVDGPDVIGYNGNTSAGYNITSSQMGYLYYIQLGNAGFYDKNGNVQAVSGLTNAGPFIQLNSNAWYWSGTEHSDYTPPSFWAFLTSMGTQEELVGYNFLSMANRPGQLSLNSPTISGTPATTDVTGTTYNFTPTSTNAASFNITGIIPPGLTFNATTGNLSGIPTTAGTYSNIVISAINARGSASLPALSITVTSAANHAPAISGSPSTTDTVGTYYTFTASASDQDGNPLTFCISNMPTWAFFNTSTGTLSGTPSSAGTYSNIQISVSDGSLTTALPAFSITVASSGGTGSTGSTGGGRGTSVPVMEGWWLLPGMLAGVGIFARRRKG